MQPAKRSETPLPAHHCPVCHHPQMKLQRRLSPTTNGSTIYVCARSGECAVGVNVTKIDTWVAV
jgi:hypothetical protein